MRISSVSCLAAVLGLATSGVEASQLGGSHSTSTASNKDTGSGTGGPDEYYKNIVLWSHNIHRANHSAPDLEWDPVQARIAAEIAATCVYAHSMIDGGNYGQNIAVWGSSSNDKLQPAWLVHNSITAEFYNGEFEVFRDHYYGMSTPPMETFENWGHLTQVVWKGTTSVGCATQFCAAGTIMSGWDSYFTVCNYSPPGNYQGEFAQNVGTPLGHKPAWVPGEFS